MLYLQDMKLQNSVDKVQQDGVNKLIQGSLLKTNTKVDELGTGVANLNAKVNTFE